MTALRAVGDLTPDDWRHAAILWSEGKSTGEIARALRADEALIWNNLTALKRLARDG